MTTLASPTRRRGRPPRATPTPRRASLPEVPLWLACTRDESLAFVAADANAPVDTGRRLALYGDVGAIALAAYGPGRGDLVAIALDARMWRGSGPDSPIRVDLHADGQVRMTLARAVDLAPAACVAEPLRRQTAGPGYREPALRTDADVARQQNRDGFRRSCCRQ